MIKAIIFDFYGVIRSDEYHDWLSLHGFKWADTAGATNDLDKGLTTSDQFFEALSKKSNIPADQIRKEFHTHATLNEKLLALIYDLKKNYRIAILSNANSTSLRDILRDASIDHLFDEVIISSEIGMTKPSTEIFEHALDKLGVQPNEAVFIDDNSSFVKASEELGLKGICFKDFESLVQELRAIDLKI